jgi:hypothetical protein
MSDPLTELKKTKIDRLIHIYNVNLNSIKNYYSTLINNVSRARYTVPYKKYAINLLINYMNNNINALKNKFNTDVAAVQNLTYTAITPGKNKNALVVGINYIGTQNQLEGCINDANSISSLLTSEGFQNIKLLTDNTSVKPTKNNIINEFTNLLANANSGDVIFFFYSGHGSYTQDQNNEEFTGYDQMIVPCDLNCIVDDDLKKIINKNLKNNVTLIAMFDSCFSESVLDLKYQYLDSLNNNNFTENNNQTDTTGNVIMISGCSDIQTSADAIINGKNQGALTWAFLETFKSQNNLTWKQLLEGMRGSLKNKNFTQIPQLSCGKFININTPVFI